MSNKDFLSQFSDENKKPDSFKEEVRIPVQKERKPINPLMIVIPVVAALIIGLLAWFFFLRPNIEVPDFVGKTQNDVAQWVTQYEINRNGIVFDEEYSMEYEEGEIISQSVEAGSKVKKDAKISFVISSGADPDESVSVPDIGTMTKSELESWVKENKLQKTKITTAYSDTVEKDGVISFQFRSCDADEFTRGCNLNISVSKGPQPAGTVTVEDFKDKTFAEAEAWAKSKKLNVEKVDAFDDEVNPGVVISQSVAAGKTMKEKETITFVVSQGKGVKVPDFSTMSRQEVDKWLTENADLVEKEERYSTKSGYILEQSVKTGAMIGSEDKLKITLNLGDMFYLSDREAPELVGGSYERLVDWCNNVRYLGIDAFAGQWGDNQEVYSEYPKGTIVSVECLSYSTGEIYPCDGRLPLDVRFSVVLSKGQVFTVDNIQEAKGTGEFGFETAKIASILKGHGITFQNNASGDYCKLIINGTEIKNTSTSVRIKEGDTVILKGIDGSIPVETEEPESTETGASAETTEDLAA